MARIYFNDAQHAAVVRSIKELARMRKSWAEMYVFVYEFYRENGYTPTLREAAKGQRIVQTSAYNRLAHLCKRGYLYVVPGKSRLIKIAALETAVSDG